MPLNTRTVIPSQRPPTAKPNTLDRGSTPSSVSLGGATTMPSGAAAPQQCRSAADTTARQQPKLAAAPAVRQPPVKAIAPQPGGATPVVRGAALAAGPGLPVAGDNTKVPVKPPPIGKSKAQAPVAAPAPPGQGPQPPVAREIRPRELVTQHPAEPKSTAATLGSASTYSQGAPGPAYLHPSHTFPKAIPSLSLPIPS